MLNRDSIEKEEEEERRCYISAREQPDADLRRYSSVRRFSWIARGAKGAREASKRSTNSEGRRCAINETPPIRLRSRVWREVEWGQVKSGVAWYESSLVPHKHCRADSIPISRLQLRFAYINGNNQADYVFHLLPRVTFKREKAEFSRCIFHRLFTIDRDLVSSYIHIYIQYIWKKKRKLLLLLIKNYAMNTKLLQWIANI